MTQSLRALLSELIDYAGLYPPAGLPLDEVLERYRRYCSSPERWMLNRLVLPASKLAEMPLEDGWRITLLIEEDPGPLPPQVQTLESRRLQPKSGDIGRPIYYEAPIEQITEGFAKIRTGGLTPDAIPTAQHVAEFLHATAALRLPFKATAGLHHPIRAEHPLSYAPDAPRAVMHGFVNVFAAAALAWDGAPVAALIDMLEETDPCAFEFRDEGLRWRGQSIDTGRIEASRREFAHSFGSCSFEEPIQGLRELGYSR